MTEHDDTAQAAIEAALRRQFSPPDLDALSDRIAAAAMAAEAEAPAELGTAVPAAANGAPRHEFAVVVAVAAALVVMLAWPRGDRPSRVPAPRDRPAVAAGPTPPTPPSLPGTTSHQVAGQQLDDFLRTADYAPGSPQDCRVHDPLLDDSAVGGGTPTLVESEDKRLVWECGGETGIDCADHDLPAKRMMIVRLLASQTDVIVCIEPPGADPRPELPSDSEFNIFRRPLGDYVLYEVTPLAQPLALPHVTI